MRIAIVSDIHGNLTAFDAVLADLRQTSPDLIFHGGDLPHGGSSPVEVLDQIRDLGWPGVLGNTDEMLFLPQSLTDSRLPQLKTMFDAIAVMADFTREALGAERLDWLRMLPVIQKVFQYEAGRGDHEGMVLVHASPDSAWRSPGPEAADAEFEATYAPLDRPLVVYGHIHRPFVRKVSGFTIANSGSVSLSYDGDARASYLLLDDGVPSIRRVEYDVEREVRALSACGLPHAEWVARSLKSSRPEML